MRITKEYGDNMRPYFLATQRADNGRLHLAESETLRGAIAACLELSGLGPHQVWQGVKARIAELSKDQTL